MPDQRNQGINVLKDDPEEMLRILEWVLAGHQYIDHFLADVKEFLDDPSAKDFLRSRLSYDVVQCIELLKGRTEYLTNLIENAK